jgi:hypothetical protein
MAHRYRIKVDGSIAPISIKNFPIGIHAMYLYSSDTPLTMHSFDYRICEKIHGYGVVTMPKQSVQRQILGTARVAVTNKTMQMKLLDKLQAHMKIFHELDI